jgi:integrase
MGRKSKHGLPPGIHLDKEGAYWATLEGDDAKRWRERFPGRTLPRRKAESLKEARQLQRQLVRDLELGRDPLAENPTIADLVERWIDQRKVATSTKRRYHQSWRWQIKPLRIGRLRVRQLNRDHIREWITALESHPRNDSPDQVIDPYTVRNAFAVLRACLNTAVTDGLIPTSPCRGIELPKPDDEEIKPMTPDQIGSLFKLIDSYDSGKPHRNAALYHVAIRCGLRQGELMGLRWRDLDLDRREIRVTGQLQAGQRKRGKTRKAHRTIPLSPDVAAILRAHQRNQAEERDLAGVNWNQAGLVFCSELGTPLSAHNLWRQFTALQRRAGLATPCSTCMGSRKQREQRCPECHAHGSVALFRMHDMRHTYAALAIAAGVDIFTLSRRMGHESITTTADRYGHLYKGQDDDATAIARLLKRGEDAPDSTIPS